MSSLFDNDPASESGEKVDLNTAGGASQVSRRGSALPRVGSGGEKPTVSWSTVGHGAKDKVG